MTFKGTVRNGSVVLEADAGLPEGAEVRVSLEPFGDVPSSDKLGIQEALESLPENASLEDFIERVYLFYKIEKGVRQLDSGQGVSDEEARQRFSQWLE